MNEQHKSQPSEKVKAGKEAVSGQPDELTEEERKALRTPPPKKHGPSVTIAPSTPATPDVFDTPPTRL